MRLPAAVLLLTNLAIGFVARSQSNELTIQGAPGKLYLEHVVVAKENWYSVGRLFNVSPKDLAPFNRLALTQPLTIGQTLQIPLTALNFSQNGQKMPAESLVPLYHIVQEKEWMYRISVNHNKVPIPNLEKWNNINKDQVHPGMHLIVGYLKVKTSLSALAGPGASAVAAGGGNAGGPVTAIATPTGGGAVQSGGGNGTASGGGAPHTVVSGTPHTGVSGDTPTVNNGVTHAAGSDGTPAGGNDAKRAAGVGAVSGGVSHPAASDVTAVVGGGEPHPVSGGVPHPADSGVRHTKGAGSDSPNKGGGNGGAFRNEFSGSGKTINGQAGIFKSTSGWQDGKYYALMNNIPVGTIVKIADATTGKTVYAKILGQLPDMKESTGLTIRLSNAGAAELGEGDAHFGVEVTY